jgi:cell division protein FtsQ
MARRTPQRRPRQSAQRQQRLRLAGWLGGSVFLLVGLIGATVHVLSQPGRLPLRVIEISGEFQHLDRAAIKEVVLANIDGGFFTCDMGLLREAVLAMPWVDDISIRRRWPDRLHMVVSEQVPLARWGEDALVNVRGQVFRPEGSPELEGLVTLSGPAGSEHRVVGLFREVIAGTRARGLRLRSLELDERRHWWLRFDDGPTVSLGREHVEHRLAQFLRVYPTLAERSSRRLERIDMRYGNGFAVRWREETLQGAAAPGTRAEGNT